MDSMREVGRKYGNTTQEADKGGSSLQSPVPPCGKKKGMVRMSPTSSARQPEKQAIMSTTLKQIDPCNSKPHDTRSPDITASVVIFPSSSYSRVLKAVVQNVMVLATREA